MVTPFLGARQIEVIAQSIQQTRPRRDVELPFAPLTLSLM